MFCDIHIFSYTCLCIYLVTCLKSLACFLVGLFIFLLLNFKSALYILDNSPLSDVSLSFAEQKD
jgi:hypothetical protein